MIVQLRKSNGQVFNIIKTHKTNGPRLLDRSSIGHTSSNIITNVVITEVNNYGSKKD
jgi:hypothetical protein